MFVLPATIVVSTNAVFQIGFRTGSARNVHINVRP